MRSAAFARVAPIHTPMHESTTAADSFFVHERLSSGRVLVRDRFVDSNEARALAPALEAAFDRHDLLGLAVARRVREDGVSAHGTNVVHPKGFHHVARGSPRDAERFDCEVDAADRGVAVIASDAFTKARGEAILDRHTGYGALALLVLSLEIRRIRAGRVIASASATLEQSNDEAQHADDALESEGFRCPLASAHARSHFGFDLEACDLDVVASKPALSALRWNAPIWGASIGFDKYDERGAYHWNLYQTHENYRRRADTLVAFLRAHLPTNTDDTLPVLDVGAGDALFAGLLARHGMRAIALDPQTQAVADATSAIAAHGLEALVTCVHGDAQSLPLAEASCRAALLLDVIEHLRNPVRALSEIHRVLVPSGVILVATPAWKFAARHDPVYHLDEYREEELVRQLTASGFTVTQRARVKGVYDDLVLLARK